MQDIDGLYLLIDQSGARRNSSYVSTEASLSNVALPIYFIHAL